jgi:hypothetical protein
MKKIFYFPIFAILSMISLYGTSYAEQSQCTPNTVCVHPGDVLSYDIHFGSANSSETFYFLDMVDPNNIKVIEQFSLGPGQTQNGTIILNINTGLGHLDQNGSQEVPFLTVLPTPIQYNKTSFTVTSELLTFNGFKRTGLSAIQGDSNMTSTLEYDKETGILLNANSLGITTIEGKPELIRYTSSLIKTNMINGDSSELGTQQKTKTSIPSWIKNNAKFWSEGTITDDDFVKGIQYLIQQGIMKVPHGSSQASSSSQPIPHWIKNNAKFWSEGTITDDDFVKGIQYLMDVGIVRV